MSARPGHAPGRTPVLLVGGIQEDATQVVGLYLQLGLPGAVTVRHVIDAADEALTRIVSDATGVLERVRLNLAHACVTCAIREDIVPTLERLSAQGRWDGVIACLPLAAEATQVCRALAWNPGRAPHVAVAAVVTALDGSNLAADLLGEDLLDERGLATCAEDARGVAEVTSAMVEYADVVCLTRAPAADELALLGALARPRVPLLCDPAELDAAELAAGVHRHPQSEYWVDAVQRGALPRLRSDAVWRLDLRSDRPFHPQRLQDHVAALGGGHHRSRGCFWLPSRPQDVCVWDGAGGQASIDCRETWGAAKPLTRLTFIGLNADQEARPTVEAAFHDCLLTDEEVARQGCDWDESWDGLEPWLGPIERIA
ncbi:MAG: cobalamin biosynthesis protein CobW [Propionibacteriaceae bacterium]|jgi:G3E family GTPase|nr:cobalamin biosynthesis protein CobW [Propionibacteriaceae bacterium]